MQALQERLSVVEAELAATQAALQAQQAANAVLSLSRKVAQLSTKAVPVLQTHERDQAACAGVIDAAAQVYNAFDGDTSVQDFLAGIDAVSDADLPHGGRPRLAMNRLQGFALESALAPGQLAVALQYHGYLPSDGPHRSNRENTRHQRESGKLQLPCFHLTVSYVFGHVVLTATFSDGSQVCFCGYVLLSDGKLQPHTLTLGESNVSTPFLGGAHVLCAMDPATFHDQFQCFSDTGLPSKWLRIVRTGVGTMHEAITCGPLAAGIAPNTAKRHRLGDTNSGGCLFVHTAVRGATTGLLTVVSPEHVWECDNCSATRGLRYLMKPPSAEGGRVPALAENGTSVCTGCGAQQDETPGVAAAVLSLGEAAALEEM